MKTIVDTSAWSAVLRRDKDSSLAPFISGLIVNGGVQMLGPIRQELLSGIRLREKFTQLRRQLEQFPDLPLDSQDYVSAAELFNVCRGKGVQGSAVDMLICAAAIRYKMQILTLDADFKRYARHIPIDLLEPPH
jgi:predicted nucleic acid-binding protein